MQTTDKLTIHHPHDSFFKDAVSDITVSRDLLKAHLDPEIQKVMQWETLRMSDRSFIDEQLHAFYSDMVYTCQVDNGSAQLYIVIEHQYTPDPTLPFRFLQYNYGILRQHIQQNRGKNSTPPFPIYY